MKNIVLVVSILFIFALSFSACEKPLVDSGDITTNLVGTWNIDKIDFSPIVGNQGEVPITNDMLGDMIFKSDGTGNTDANLLPGINLGSLNLTNFTWTAENSNVTLNFGTADISLAITYNARINESNLQEWNIVSFNSSGDALQNTLNALIVGYNVVYDLSK